MDTVSNAPNQTSKLARLALEISEARDRTGRLSTLVETIDRTGLYTTATERSLLADLEGYFEQIAAILARVREKTSDTADDLQELDDLLSAFEWDIAGEMVADLESKRAIQEKRSAELRDHLTEWTQLLEAQRPIIQRLVARGALAGSEQDKYKELEARVTQVRLAREGGRLAEALGTAQKLETISADLEELVGRATKGEDLTRTADLLLLRSPSSEGHEYTVLLRTPSRPGSHRFHIQDSTASVTQDREWIDEQLAIVANRMKGGLGVRYVKSGTAGTAPPEAAVPITPPLPAAVDAAVAAGVGVAALPAAAAALGATRQLSAEPEESGATAIDLNGILSDVGDLMYRLVLPEYVQDYLKDDNFRFSFTITTNDLEVPWELMCYEDSVLCLERPVGRMPLGRARPRRPSRELQRSGKYRFLLVYCDPDGTLVNARHEIESISNALSTEYKDSVELHVWPEEKKSKYTAGRRLNDVLRRAEYDVIHFAGHATFNAADADLSALIMDDRVPFYAQKIRRLLKGQPLVFLNACESATVANEREDSRSAGRLQRPVEGLAAAFVYGGALGCIGSLWPVHDAPAHDLAIHFYKHVLRGEMIGEALRQARKAVKSKPEYARDITWASFVLYGDPTFRL